MPTEKLCSTVSLPSASSLKTTCRHLAPSETDSAAFILWANTYDGELGDTLELEKRVAEEVADHVLAQLATRNQSSSAPSRVIDSRALEEYLQGTYHLNRFSRGSGDEELKLAAEHFQHATEIDQNFALAYVKLANAHDLTFRSSNDDLKITTQATHRAIQLDPTLSDAWVELGNINRSAWSWGEAEVDFRQAIALNPNNAWAHDELANLLDILGEPDEGWRQAEIAQELDPAQDHRNYALLKRHEYDRAIQVVLRNLGTDPNNGILHHQLFESYSGKGMYKEAIEQLQQAAKLFGFPDLAVKLANAYAASGYTGAIREYAQGLAHLHSTKQAFMPINIAAAYTAAGDRERAFYWLEEGYRQKGRQTTGVRFEDVGVYPALDPLHSDPRFTNLLERMRLPAARIDASGRSQETTDKASVNP
jgi:tetratricopeptide (TPR) repeat protein